MDWRVEWRNDRLNLRMTYVLMQFGRFHFWVMKKASMAYLSLSGMVQNIKSWDVLLQLYKALIRLHFEYRVQFWSPNDMKSVIALERVQWRFISMVPHSKALVIKSDQIGWVCLPWSEEGQEANQISVDDNNSQHGCGEPKGLLQFSISWTIIMI